MIDRRREREIIIALCCALTCLLFMVLFTGSEATRRAMSWTARMARPLEQPVVALEERFKGLISWVADRDRLLSSLLRLEEENRALNLTLGQKDVESFKLSVIDRGDFLVDYRDPRGWWDEVRVDTGGVTSPPAGSPAMDGSSLVGVVLSSDRGIVWIRLITSSSLYLPIVIESTRDVGVVVGDDQGGVWLRYASHKGEDYPPGLRLVTALCGSQLPPGLFVGTLSGKKRELTPGMVEYEVLPGAQLTRLQSVALLEARP